MSTGQLNVRGWRVTNLDFPLEVVESQFEASLVTEGVVARYKQFLGLNRLNPIRQYLGGETDQVRLQGRLYQTHAADIAPQQQIDLLKKFVRRDEGLGRPPILSFQVGDGHVILERCTLDSITDINYDRPNAQGAMRGAAFTLTFSRFESFELESGVITESRFARVKEREYYELLAQREYGDPLLGDRVRKRHPDNLNPFPGDVVKLPSLRAVRREQVVPESIPFKTLTGQRTTLQTQLRSDAFDRYDRPRVSYVVTGGAAL